jgi:hypothetical protein
MWIEAKTSSRALLSDGKRMVGDGAGSHVWSLETGERLLTLWDWGGFELAPGDGGVVHADGYEISIYDLSGRRRGRGRGRFRGFSRDGAHVFCEPLEQDLHIQVIDLDGTKVGVLDTGFSRGRNLSYHPAMDDMTPEEIIACSGGPCTTRVIDLHDGLHVVETSQDLQIRKFGGTRIETVREQEFRCVVGDGRFFVTTDEHGVTVFESASGRSGRIAVWLGSSTRRATEDYVSLGITTQRSVTVDRSGRLLCPYHEIVSERLELTACSLSLLVVDPPQAGTRRQDFRIGDWQLQDLLPGNGVVAIALGARRVAFLDVEGGRVMETVELETDFAAGSDPEQTVVALVTSSGRFEVWNIEPPILIERDQLEAGARSVTVGPRHVVVTYPDRMLVRPRPPSR